MHCHDTRQKNDFHMYSVQSVLEKKLSIHLFASGNMAHKYKSTKLWNNVPDNIKRIVATLF